jgi:hypothetical protein
MADPLQIVLTDSQLEQLTSYQREAGEGQSVLLWPAESLGSGYVEAVLLDAEGAPTRHKRVLFPS